MALDLTPEMRQIGAWFRQELEQSVRKQRGFDGSPFRPVTIETARSRQRANNRFIASTREQRREQKKKIGGRIPFSRKKLSTKIGSIGGLDFKRLFFTKKFVEGAFRAAAFKDYVKVMAWPGTYPGSDVSYRDIVRWNNAGSSDLNPAIDFPAKVFPVNRQEVEKMAAFKRATAHLKSPVTIRKVVGREYKKKLTVLLG